MLRRAAEITGLVLVAGLGCSSNPDVVVEQQPVSVESPPLEVEPLNGCLPGHYRGVFLGVTRIGGSESRVFGDIEFSLVESQRGEFLVITNSLLRGQTDSGLAFSAEFASAGDQSCTDAHFRGALDGTFDIGSGVPFLGTVSGEYSEKRFDGLWTATFPSLPDLVSEGDWHSFWVGGEP